MIDLVKPRPGGDLLVEIQTGSFGAMGAKLDRVLSDHEVVLVHPIAVRTRLERTTTAGEVRRRWSPRRGSVLHLFEELVSIPTLLDHPHLSLEIVLLTERRIQVEDRRLRRGRGGYRTVDRQVEEIVERRRFSSPDDLADLLPPDLPDEFTTADIATGLGCGRDLAQKMAFCLRAAEQIEVMGRTRAGYHYRRV